MRGANRWAIASVFVVIAIAATAAASVFLSGGSGHARQSAVVARARAIRAYARLPLAFVPNRGQDAHGVRLTTQGAGFAAGLTDSGVTLELSRSSRQAGSTAGAQRARIPQMVDRSLGLAFLRERRGVSPKAADALAGRVNYLIGKTRQQWRTDLPTYAQAAYGDVWPGIDATFSGSSSRLEYTFEVAPGADPGQIALAYRGGQSVRLDSDGSLAVSAGDRLGVRQLAPRAYQLQDGRRVAVSSRYRLDGNRLGIAVGAYDHQRPLIIDPTVTLAYSTYFGGSDDDYANGIAVDSAGEAYITGATTSDDLPATDGSYQPNPTVPEGDYDAFVTKLSADGSQVLWTTYLGGSQYGEGTAIALDSAGDAYVTGDTEATDFPVVNPLPDGGTAPSDSGENAFVSELNSSGTALVYSTYLSGSGQDYAEGIAVDSQGDAYVTGYTSSTDYFTTPGAYQTSGGGSYSGFVTELNSDDAYVYSTYLDEDDTSPYAIAVNGDGQAWVAGQTYDANYPVTDNAYEPSFLPVDDEGSMGFATEMNPTGTALSYSTFLGGSGGDDGAYGVAVNASGEAFVTGETDSTDFPTTPGVVQPTFGGDYDAFVTAFEPSGTVIYSTYLGGPNFDGGYAIAADSAGDAYVTGETGEGDDGGPLQPSDARRSQTNVESRRSQANVEADGFPLVDPIQSAFGGVDDAFVSAFTPDGSALIYSTYLGGSDYDYGEGIAVDSNDSAYVTGGTYSTDFPLVGPADSNAQPEDAFISKIGVASTSTPPPPPPPVSGGSGSAPGVPVDVTPPTISGTPLPGDTLTCSTGTWTNSPTGYSYQWDLGGVAIPGATGTTFVVKIADEARNPSDAMTCVVTASNSAGAGSPATSAGVLIAVPGTSHCPVPTGRLSGLSVGVLRLGMTRVQARQTLTRYTVTHNLFDNFCLYAGWGIRVAYPPNALLDTVSAKTRSAVQGRIVIALTANPFYSYDGMAPGATASALARHLKLSKPFYVGSNTWYIVKGRPANAVFKVRHGVVQEVGLVSRALTGSRPAQRRLLHSFKNA